MPEWSLEDLRKQLLDLQQRVQILETGPCRKVDFLDVAPTKPREGMIYGADGTNWNPGTGKGIYAYYGGAWVKL